MTEKTQVPPDVYARLQKVKNETGVPMSVQLRKLLGLPMIVDVRRKIKKQSDMEVKENKGDTQCQATVSN